MYRYISNKSQAKPYRQECTMLLSEVRKQLKDELKIRSMITLIGSGSQKLITQNGNGTFDLDYNLMIHKLPKDFEKNPKKLKDFVRTRLDSAIKAKNLNYSPGKDSTSVITYIKHNEIGQKVFSFDLGIVTKISSNKNWNRLLYNKEQNSYVWAQQRNSSKILSRAKELRKQGYFPEVRKVYLDKKNEALKKQEDISSFSIFASTVNEVEQKFNGKK